MTKFKAVQNEQTGKTDYNFPAELKSVGTKEFENSNGTKYVLGTVDFTYPNGTPAKAVTTQIFAKSLAHGMKVGDSLLSTLSRDDNNTMWIRTSHLLLVTLLTLMPLVACLMKLLLKKKLKQMLNYREPSGSLFFLSITNLTL